MTWANDATTCLIGISGCLASPHDPIRARPPRLLFREHIWDRQSRRMIRGVRAYLQRTMYIAELGCHAVYIRFGYPRLPGPRRGDGPSGGTPCNTSTVHKYLPRLELPRTASDIKPWNGRRGRDKRDNQLAPGIIELRYMSPRSSALQNECISTSYSLFPRLLTPLQ